jgi:predicted transcriptional regulator
MVQIKTEVEGIIRDTTNGALLNRDNDSLSAYKKLKKKNAESEEIKSKVNNMEKEIFEIKSLLYKLLEKNG